MLTDHIAPIAALYLPSYGV